jgi:hypothetical protein
MADFKTALVNLSVAIALCGPIPAAAALAEHECPPSCAATPANDEPGQGDRIVPQSDNRQRIILSDKRGATAATGQQARPAGDWTHRPGFQRGVMDRWRPRFRDLRRRG